MLVLTRKRDETTKTILDEETLKELLAQVQSDGQPVVLTTTIIKIKGNVVRIGTDAPRCVRVVRGEIPVNSSKETTVEPAGDTSGDSGGE